MSFSISWPNRDGTVEGGDGLTLTHLYTHGPGAIGASSGRKCAKAVNIVAFSPDNRAGNFRPYYSTIPIRNIILRKSKSAKK